MKGLITPSQPERREAPTPLRPDKSKQKPRQILTFLYTPCTLHSRRHRVKKRDGYLFEVDLKTENKFYVRL